MNNEQLRDLLVDKYDYKESQVDAVVEKIGKFSACTLKNEYMVYMSIRIDAVNI